MEPILTSLITQLGSLVAKGTAARITTRIQTVKANKDRDAQFNELSEIINELLDERSQLVAIAQSFKEELTSQRITEEEISYITEQVIPKAEELFFTLDEGSEGDDEDETKKMLEAVKTLLSPELLTVLQLVGFNYKAAIGEPLTDVVASSIRSAGPSES
ncbi:hypothetical protein [Arthrobacter sp. 179]|uniref:hypothetical protein n=1 Tax=Arthrobacter sp. 179 TaxID=3457734 RepID=UPI00403384B1